MDILFFFKLEILFIYILLYISYFKKYKHTACEYIVTFKKDTQATI